MLVQQPYVHSSLGVQGLPSYLAIVCRRGSLHPCGVGEDVYDIVVFVCDNNQEVLVRVFCEVDLSETGYVCGG